jgi:hypothetical protein
MTMENKMKEVRRLAEPRKRAHAVAPKGKRADIDYLRDHERGAQPAVKYHPNRMPMQAAPDHGDHE